MEKGDVYRKKRSYCFWVLGLLCLALLLPGQVSAKSKGWETVNGKTYYYQNGVKQKNWQKIKGAWYFFNKRGVMQTGWVEWKGETYYIKADGRMASGLKTIQGKTYYFNKSGAMEVGWQKVKGKWRFFRKKTGVMAVNCVVGKRKIDAKGIWTPQKVVVLDPGHSGVVASGTEPLGPGSSERKARDASGTQGVATGVPEYRLTLQIAQKLEKELTKRGYEVLLTRTDHDTPISCKERAMVANKAKADAYVRIHANGSASSAVQGAMTICTTKNSPYAAGMYAKSRKLSEDILNAYTAKTGARKEYIWETDSMSGNNWSKVPTTILEMGYMTNPQEDRRMQSAAYQKKMVQGIAEGIERFLQHKK